ncbi:MAG: hypothetical protein ACYC8T_37065 [Myxococcaceae bacterium]
MHVLLVGAELEENLALRYLAAALERAGHTAEFAPFGNPEEQRGVLDRARERRPPRRQLLVPLDDNYTSPSVDLTSITSS